MAHISPELVLVDPELRRLALELLPDPPDCLAPRPAPAVAVLRVPTATPPVAVERAHVAPAVPAERLPRPQRARRGRRFSVVAVAGWAVVAAVIASPLLAFLPPPESERPQLVESVPTQPQPMRPAKARPTKLAPTPPPAAPPREWPTLRPPTTTSAAVLVRWRADRKADLYNLILVGGGDRLDLWPRRNIATLVPARKSDRRAARLVTYTWFAYPGYRTARGVRYGKLLGHGTVRVPAGSVKGQQRRPGSGE